MDGVEAEGEERRVVEVVNSSRGVFGAEFVWRGVEEEKVVEEEEEEKEVEEEG